MDKSEYQNRLSMLEDLVKKKDYKGALSVVNSVDWKRVKNFRTLSMVADVYEANRMYPEAKKILTMAYERSSRGKSILYRLTEICIRVKDFKSAEEYYEEYLEVARNDSSRYLLKYKLLKGKGAPLSEQIKVLEAYKDSELTERWGYELALLYKKADNPAKCVELCDDLILWFNEGKYVMKAMELKMEYEPLTAMQQRSYERNSRIRTEGGSSATAERPVVEPIGGTRAAAPTESGRTSASGKGTKPSGYTSPYLGNTTNLRAELSKSLREVFPTTAKEQEAAREEAAATVTPEDPSDYRIRDLEPEKMDVRVKVSPEAQTMIRTRPEPKKAAPTQEPAVETGDQSGQSSSYGDLDLEALFRETASNLSEEIAAVQIEAEQTAKPASENAAGTGEAEQTAAEEPAEEPAAEAAEEAAEEPAPTAEAAEKEEEQKPAAEAVEQPAEGPEPTVEAVKPTEQKPVREAVEAAEKKLSFDIMEESTEKPSREDTEEPAVKAEAEAESAAKISVKPEAGSAVKDTEEPEARSAVKNVEESGTGSTENAAGESSEESAVNVAVKPEEETAANPVAVPAADTAEKSDQENAAETAEGSDQGSAAGTAEGSDEESAAKPEQNTGTAAKPIPAIEIEEEPVKFPTLSFDLDLDEEPQKPRVFPQGFPEINPVIREVPSQKGTTGEEAAEGSAREESIREESIKEEPAKAEPVQEELITEEPARDESAAEESAGQESVTEESAAAPVQEATPASSEGTPRSTQIPEAEVMGSPEEEAELVKVSPEDVNLTPPAEPQKEAVADATIEMGEAWKVKGAVEPKSIEEVLREETPEEQRIRILNDTRPEKLTTEQRALFTYFARVPGMDQQILDALHGVYQHVGEKTSHRGNIAIMGGYGTGKTRLSESLLRAICVDLKIPATKMARLDATDLNRKDPARVIGKLAGGFLLIERAGLMYPETIEKLSKAMDFRTDSLILIIEDEKVSMRGMFNNHPEFADKFENVITIPVFTNDELVTFARTYARENGYRIDEMGVLALYTQIGNNQKEGEPMTITQVKKMMDQAIAKAQKGTRKLGRKMSGRHKDADDRIVLYEKDFDF